MAKESRKLVAKFEVAQKMWPNELCFSASNRRPTTNHWEPSADISNDLD
jgi:hypothetical protein